MRHLLDVAAKLIDSRKPRTEHVVVAHELLAAFHDTCLRAGLDGVLAALEQEFPGVDASEPTAFFDGPLTPALTAQLATFDLDDGSPRSAKPVKLVDSVVTALHLTVVDDAPAVSTLDGSVRTAVAAAIAKVIETELAAPSARLNETQQTVVLRIVQEALQNVRKHGGASSVIVASAIDGDDWVLTVRDDGRGFDIGAVAARGRRNFGLQFMQERAELIGARFEVQSRPNAGTVVRLAIPLGAEETA